MTPAVGVRRAGGGTACVPGPLRRHTGRAVHQYGITEDRARWRWLRLGLGAVSYAVSADEGSRGRASRRGECAPFQPPVMDVFKIDQSLGGSVGRALSPSPSPDKEVSVSFDAGSEFNLCFFDAAPEDSAQGFSDPGSVGSTSASSPPPPPLSLQPPLPQPQSQHLATLHVPLPGTSTPANNPGLLSPPATNNSSAIHVKQGTPNHNDIMSYFFKQI